VCVDSYQDGVPKGSFSNAYLDETVSFESLTRLLTGIENRLEEMNFPQAFESIRRFETFAKSEPTEVKENMLKRGKLATFTVRILFRQNTSWQGYLMWMEKGREESFRSVLELIFLMDSALSQTSSVDPAA